MAGITLEKDKRIYTVGQPMTALHMITKGKVSVEHPGGVYQLGKGDIIGVCELCSEVHFLGYITTEETVILTYPVNNTEALADLLLKHPDVARLFLLSLFRQIGLLQEQSTLSEMNSTSLHQNLMEDYEKYNSLCNLYRLPPCTSNNLEELGAFLSEDAPDEWLNAYYIGLRHLYSAAGETTKTMLREPGLSLGLLYKGSQDYRAAFSVLEEHSRYRSTVAGHYFNSSGSDLFELFSSLYLRLGQNNEDAEGLYRDLNRIIEQFENDPSLDKTKVSARIADFRSSCAKQSAPVEQAEVQKEDGMSATILQDLKDSLSAILEYADVDPECAASFRDHVQEFKELEDRNAMEDKCNRLRRQLTDEFYKVYAHCFEKSITTPYLPIPVKMFLFFGYADEELAGSANCVKLYNLACGMEDQSHFGVYTLYHWLLAIYNGDKNPSRNEFDEDFLDYIHKQKQSGNITTAQMIDMEGDPMARVTFEMENLFPQVNKMTCGRISTFCPLFSADNVLKDLNTAFVTTAQISKAFATIRSIDFSAYYRESLDLENAETMGKETIHLEFLPDIVLMPNVGIRGVMWQEIDGKKCNSPGRMFFSIFHMEDVNTTLVRLTGEFRWEMCKRIQGTRWNDVSERSLTSEYFDYVQFYRKNHELSAEAKERIRNSLQRAKNSFKEMFVRDYIIWVMFEGTGSPRLNKVARKILFTYCPFPASLAATMEQNPIYTELMSRQKVLSGQRIHRLDMLRQKLKNGNIPIPASLEKEINFTAGKI